MGPHAFSQPWAQDLSNQIVNEIHEEYQWIFGSQATPSREPQGKMLDFACGNGLLSRVSRTSPTGNTDVPELTWQLHRPWAANLPLFAA